MTGDEQEAFYEREILPILKKLADITAEKRIPFMAYGCFDNRRASSSISAPRQTTFPAELVRHAIECGGDVDRLLLKIMEECSRHRVSSVILAALGGLVIAADGRAGNDAEPDNPSIVVPKGATIQ